MPITTVDLSSGIASMKRGGGPYSETPRKEKGGYMLNLIRQFLTRRTNNDWAETQWVAVETEPSIYPLILARGNYLVTVEETTSTWQDVTPIVNEDSTITLTRNGHIIGHINHYETIGRT